MPLRTKLYVSVTLLCAAAVTTWALHFAARSWFLFLLFLVAILLSSGLKVALPRGDGGMSLNFPFILLAVIQLSPAQAILLAAISIAAQSRFRVQKVLTFVQSAFNVASCICATAAACATFLALSRYDHAVAPALAFAAVAYFLVSTSSVALVIASSTGENAFSLWKKEFPWYLPFYIVGAVLAAATNWVIDHFGWATSLLLIPMVYTIYRAYNSQVTRLREREQYLEATKSLHHRTIEGLSMAIEAKDQSTHEHLFRVRDYVTEIAGQLHLSELEIAALRTAAFLHDIGKLAVPEHIINKPGKLTPEEFEKMKIHPVVGADILERVRFPYPVVPIVRSHHEWWNGTGYPDGLKGEDIPIGARVLSAADCFDALVSDRPYRKGISGQEAIALLKRMSGIQFDPQVIDVMEKLYPDLGAVRGDVASQDEFTPLNTAFEVWRGEAPAIGFEDSRTSIQPQLNPNRANPLALNLIAAASQEAQALYELSQLNGVSLSLDEIITIVAARLRRLIPFDSCALYVRHGDAMTLRYIDGESARFFSSTPVPFGEGITGWVAQSGKPILNGNANLEKSYESRFGVTGQLRSALSIPLFDLQQQVFGVLTLYSLATDSFERDHLRILLAMSSKLSLSLCNAMQVRIVEMDPETDLLTGLPNARRLFLQLEAELDSCRDTGISIAVVVCNLNRLRDVSDQRGPLAANSFLSLVAHGFRRSCRPVDTVGRMGGHEFVFLFPDIDRTTLSGRMLEVATTIDTASNHAAFGIPVSASFGSAIFPNDGTTAEDLLALADRRMYLEKRSAQPTPELPMVHAAAGFDGSLIAQRAQRFAR